MTDRRLPHGWWIAPAALLGGLIIGGTAAVMAFGQDTYRWNGETYVTMQPSSRPGVEAEVMFANTGIHSLSVYAFTLSIDGLAVDVRVEINASGADDLITVTPPAGFMAVPPELLVPEDGGGRIDIVAMGMM